MRFPVFMAAAFASAAMSGCALAEAPISEFEPLQVQTSGGVTMPFSVEIADDDDEREQGLMFRKSLDPDKGMLFIFHESAVRSFWMRNTLIPLDIIYINDRGRVVSIAAQTTPLSEAGILSAGPAQFVLELRGGRAAEIGLQPGDQIIHRAIP